jgi:dienelactone hydrolase
VLIGHGATRHKRTDHILALARRLVRRHGFAATAIDSPRHGERRADPRADDVAIFADFLSEWTREGTVDDMVAEWSATLEAVREVDEVGDGPVGYWGLSMGTIYGLPFTATEPRVQVAVFGLMGLVGPTRDRLAADAPRVTCPVLFIQQWDDRLLPRAEVLALFDALGSLDKRLHAHPGDHAAVPAEEAEFSVNFLARHLAGG